MRREQGAAQAKRWASMRIAPLAYVGVWHVWHVWHVWRVACVACVACVVYMWHVRVREGGHRARRPYLVVSDVGPLELQNDSADDEVSDFWQLRVDDGDHGRVHVREVRRGHLRFDDRASQQSLSAQYVFIEQLHDHVLYIGRVDLSRKIAGGEARVSRAAATIKSAAGICAAAENAHTPK